MHHEHIKQDFQDANSHFFRLDMYFVVVHFEETEPEGLTTRLKGCRSPLQIAYTVNERAKPQADEPFLEKLCFLALHSRKDQIHYYPFQRGIVLKFLRRVISICSSAILVDRTLLTRSRTPMHNDKHRRSISSARAFSSGVRSSGFFLKMGLPVNLAVAGVTPGSVPISASCYYHY